MRSREGADMTLRHLLPPYVSALLLAVLGPCLSHADAVSQDSTIVMARDFMFAPTLIHHCRRLDRYLDK